MASGASNLGPSNPELLDAVAARKARVPARQRPRRRRAGSRGRDHRFGLRSRPAHLAGQRPPAGAARRGGARCAAGARATLGRRGDGGAVARHSSATPASTYSSSTWRSTSASSGGRHEPRHAAHLPRRRARRRQDVRDAQRGSPPPGARRGRRGGLRRVARSAADGRPGRRSRGRARARPSPTGTRSSRRWTSTRSSRGGPQLALVDELAHTNVPGCRNQKRWQDVEELLDAGIDVISNLNIQHLESLNDVVEQITGVVQRETIPDEVVRRADQLQLVDLAVETIRARLARGDIYPAERIDAALGNYFRAGNLAALRELALLWIADRVEEGLAEYRARHGISEHVGDARARPGRPLRVGRRRPARAPRGAHGAAPERRPDRRARAPADRPGDAVGRSARAAGAAGRAAWAAATARSPAPTSARRWSRPLAPSTRRRSSSAPRSAPAGASSSTARSSAR